MSALWIACVAALTPLVWLLAFAGILAVAKRAHDDVPVLLATKLPLLKMGPELIFAGESRMAYQVDAALAAQLMGKTPGSAINIAYDAGEPLALLAAMRRSKEQFRNAHVVMSVAPFLFNEGVRSAGVFPQDVAARLGVGELLREYLPVRVGTLIRFVREAFASRLTAEQGVAIAGPLPPDFGSNRIDRSQPEERWPRDIGSHAHYANWNLAGPKARFGIAALCDMTPLVRRLTVVIPPWAPRYDRTQDPLWRERDGQYVALVTEAGGRCGFEVLYIQSIPGLEGGNYADEMHVNRSGIPLYTRYLMSRLKP